VIGAGIVIFVLLYLGTNKFAAPAFTTQTRTTIPDPKARAESSSGAGAAKPAFRVPLKTMPAYLREIEARVNKMPAPQREQIMEKLKHGAY